MALDNSEESKNGRISQILLGLGEKPGLIKVNEDVDSAWLSFTLINHKRYAPEYVACAWKSSKSSLGINEQEFTSFNSFSRKKWKLLLISPSCSRVFGSVTKCIIQHAERNRR